ncbi:major facilitator superfamily domain-containing protein [Stachybotrys elegans]|uniref:Major facilitator superfamily domain-containing protein n=1 Tax=Stachybotrys elegans TaxID=80388 RepID=A0A8K0WUL1_9HYPO|nr:major facilitator superfamily domain-containing protein [Stachybotrys elegans]
MAFASQSVTLANVWTVSQDLPQDIVPQPASPPDTLADPGLELARIRTAASHAGLPVEGGSPTAPIYQGIPREFKSLAAEIVFVLVCTSSQVILSLGLGQVVVVQTAFRVALGIHPTQVPWLASSAVLASGLSVIIAGSLADLGPPKPMMVGAFLWAALWNMVASFAISPRLRILFFVSRGLQGFAVGIVVSASMSILGRIYQPGIRKNRVFSLMSAGAPFGFWIGCVQGGVLDNHLPWIFRSTSLLFFMIAVAAFLVLPPLTPAKDSADADAPSLRQFDYFGALLASTGCGLILFGLTQGSSAHWSPYTYSLVIVGLLMFVGFYFVERSVARPLIPNGLWRTPDFAPLLLTYFLGFGAFRASSLTTALYFLPNGIPGALAAWIVSKTLHIFPGHWILTASMLAFALGPAFFLPQTPDTSYWALSLPGVTLATFGPDLSFAAASIFVTSSVPRSYQGSAGSLLIQARTDLARTDR